MTYTETLKANGIELDCQAAGDSTYQLRKVAFTDTERAKMLELANVIAATFPFVKAVITKDGEFWLASEFRADLDDEFGLLTAAQAALAIADAMMPIEKHIYTLQRFRQARNNL